MNAQANPGLVVWMRNPFVPSDRRVLEVFGSPTIAQWLDAGGIALDQPTLILRNGHPVLMHERAVTPIHQGDVVALVALPQGGGGGGKNPLRTVLMIAVLVVANAYGGALAASMGYSGTLATAVASTAIAVTGSVLVNALVPLPNQTLPNTAANSVSPSPTYSLQGRGNYGRLSQPIPVIYGQHLVYPDLAATPYSEYANNEEYLYQLHVIGIGHFVFEELLIDDSPINAFEEIQAQVIEPGGSNTLFNHDVVAAPEVSGQELIAVADGGRVVGPFVINPVATQIDQIGIDVVMLRGLYYANDSGALESRSIQWRVEARSVNEDGDATSGWMHLADETFSASTNTAQRLTYKYTVAPGRYEVRVQRLDNRDTSNRAGHEIRWTQAKGYLCGASLPDDLTYLALRMRATDNLSQRSSRLVNCLVTRMLPVWSAEMAEVGGAGWSALQPTRSIAWAFADAAKAAYGAGLPDAQMDLAALARLDAVWAARGDTFNGVFDQNLTVWDALGQIARVGRAVPFLQGGIVRIVRDEPRAVPVALFSTRNIVRNSLKIQYVMPGDATADAVTVEYFNPKSWKPDEVTVALAGSKETKPARLKLFGCTDKLQAMREGKYIAAANRYRRRIVTFRTELEGLIPTYGDLVAISHDMPQWGTSGEVLAWDAVANTVLCSEALPWRAGAPHYLVFRLRGGATSEPIAVTQGSSPRHAVLALAPAHELQTGSAQERSHFAFGVGQTWAQLARVMSVRPRAEQIELTCVTEHPLVHTADLS
ncbi:MAG: phage tail protein [Rhodoferax sp.]|nr:phage tail protein [Rhodoferax sp.]